MSADPEQSAWERAARALAAGDSGALDAACRSLPPAAARVLGRVAALPAAALPPAPGLPGGVELLGDSRFAAFFARRPAVLRWARPGRELVTGCYIAPGGSAEFRFGPGECRFIILRGEGGA